MAHKKQIADFRKKFGEDAIVRCTGCGKIVNNLESAVMQRVLSSSHYWGNRNLKNTDYKQAWSIFHNTDCEATFIEHKLRNERQIFSFDL